ncbi:MAG: alpha/beta hydrolase fold domain-containing protein [Verrucomicrobiales bacterium]|nr:alpha/beta hydrolase fold domain-containing protein [Verrucomicrobiales bacterium]
MKKSCLFLLVLGSGLISFAQERASRFEQWDRNKDGTLTVEELPEILRKNFSRVDRDGDGVISREEDAAIRDRSGKGKGKGPGLPDSVEKLADLDYAGTKNPRQALDLFLPKERSAEAAPLPLVVFIHGGGWRNGDKSSGWTRLRELVESGDYAAASIGYRLSGEAQWPAQIHDCKAAVRWLRAHASGYGYDPEKIAVWGSSAGGHLVAMLGVSSGVGELEGSIGTHGEVSSGVTCVVNFFGPSELLTMNDHPSTIDHDATTSPESLLIGGAIQENPDKAKKASPIHWVSPDDKPSLIVHGTEDQLVPYPQSVEFEKKLEGAGVPTVLLTVEGGGHGKGFGPAVTEAVKVFLDHHLRGQEKTVNDATIASGR